MATFQEVLRRRRMVREFDQWSLEPDLVDRVLESARHAPSAGFSPSFDFVVLDQPEALTRFWELTDDPPSSRIPTILPPPLRP